MKQLPLIKYALLGISALIMLAWLFFMPLDSVDAMLYWCYLLFGVAVALLIIMPLINMIRNPKAAMRSMIGLAIVAVVCVVAYTLGDPDPVPNSAGGFFENAAINKLSDMGLYLTYFAMAATIVVAVYGEIRNAFK